jgi:hypothetical protein
MTLGFSLPNEVGLFDKALSEANTFGLEGNSNKL